MIRWRSLCLAGLGLLALGAAAHAAPSPFGIATPDSAGGAGWAGPLAPLFAWIATVQAGFYRTLTGALGDLRGSAGAAWALAGVSFLYGIFHAAGPGHGKAVVTSYLLASGDTLRRGIAIAFAASLVQAVVAVVFVSVAALIFRTTAMAMTRATEMLEMASYAMIAAVGAWMLWSRVTGRGHSHPEAAGGLRPMPAAVERGPFACDDGSAPAQHSHSAHSHAPDPDLLKRPLTLATAWAAILAVGIRPCSGAIIVLVFALSQGVYAMGIASTFVMAVGTGITVAALASIAVLAKDVALRFIGRGSGAAARIYRGLEIAAASAVLLFGLLLLGGALSTARIA